MRVGNLQTLLSHLSRFLLESEGKKVGDELERIRAGLEPFKDMTAAEFVTFLGRAEEYLRTGAAGAARAARKPAAVDQEKVRLAAQQVLALAERATDPDLPYATIASEVQQLDKRLKLRAPEAIQVAREVGISAGLKTKKAALDEIRRMIEGRKETFQRVQTIGQPVPSAPPPSAGEAVSTAAERT
jgi:hypothetical protein